MATQSIREEERSHDSTVRGGISEEMAFEPFLQENFDLRSDM